MDLSAFRQRLLDFFDESARDLPWRRTADPFHIWVSEVMLQQTRVDTVVPYYERWVSRFPTVRTFADTDLDEVLPLWEGLGYYSRVRNLHRAAQLVRDQHDGVVPNTLTDLRALPGVGAYTAGAVASIAFGTVTPVVDGNVRRVFSRLFDEGQPSEEQLWEWADRLLDPERPGDHNQALMELGAMVCTPREPSCEDCPVSTDCLALQQGTVDQRPAPKKRRAPREARFVSLVLWTPAGRTLLARRPDRGLLARLWEFPTVEVDREPAQSSDCLPPVPHAFTHIRATYYPLLLRTPVEPETEVDALAAVLELALQKGITQATDFTTSAMHLTDGSDLASTTLPVAQQKIMRALRERVAVSSQYQR